MKPIRKISNVEQLYEDVQSATNAYAIQYLFKIKTIKNLKELERTINQTIKNRPGTNIYIKKGYYYHQQKPIKIQCLKFSNQKTLYDAEILRKKIDLSNHSLEVFYIKTNTSKYLLFRFSHSVLDGKGALLFIQNIINSLNKKALVACENTINEKEFVKKLTYYKKREPKFPIIVNKKSSPINQYKVKWKIIEIDEYIPAIIAKLSCILAKEFDSNQTRFMIPTDLRRHNRTNNYMGNLTLPIFLNVGKNDNYEKVNGDLLYNLKCNKELNLSNTPHDTYRYVPRFVRSLGIKIGCKAINHYNKYSIGAIISHLGRINIDDYSNNLFEIEDFISLPVQQPLGAFSIVILEHSHKTNIAISYYEGQFKEDYLNELTQKIRQNLRPYIYTFNNTTVKYNDNYANILMTNLKNMSDQPAIIADKNQYTYYDLLVNIEKLNGLFKQKSVHGPIILYLERSFDYISAVLACIFNKITFIPVDKTTKKNQLDTIIKESKAYFILSDSALQTTINVLLTAQKNNVKRKRIVFKYNGDDEAYNIYTSGTTGTPKCIPITNNNLNNYLMWCKNQYKTSAPMVAPLFTSISVDLTMTSTILPLLCNGAIKVFPDNFNHNTLKKIFNDKKINLIKLTPTHLSFFKPLDNDQQKELIVIIGGENLPVKYCKTLQSSFKKATIYNEYGPAETTVGTIYHIYNQKEDTENVPIGVPINNTGVVLYDNSIITKQNQTGEILISGDSVFRGYKNTRKNPFKLINGIKYYRTGDYGYIHNNKLFYLGRQDNQIKKHGYRVELNDIQNTLMRIDSVKDAVVISEDKLIYAFIKTSDKVTSRQILNLLASVSPNYAIPDRLAIVKHFPINSSGKIDKQKLIKTIEIADKTTKRLSSNRYDLLNVLNSIKTIEAPNWNKPLIEIGLDSLDMVTFIQKCQETYIKEQNEDSFVSEIFKKIGIITLKDLEKIIAKYRE